MNATRPEPDDTAVERWLADRHCEFVTDLGGVMDVDAGLRDALLPARYRAFVGDLSKILDLDTGLATIVPPTRGNTNRGPMPAQADRAPRVFTLAGPIRAVTAHLPPAWRALRAAVHCFLLVIALVGFGISTVRAGLIASLTGDPVRTPKFIIVATVIFGLAGLAVILAKIGRTGKSWAGSSLAAVVGLITVVVAAALIEVSTSSGGVNASAHLNAKLASPSDIPWPVAPPPGVAAASRGDTVSAKATMTRPSQNEIVTSPAVATGVVVDRALDHYRLWTTAEIDDTDYMGHYTGHYVWPSPVMLSANGSWSSLVNFGPPNPGHTRIANPGHTRIAFRLQLVYTSLRAEESFRFSYATNQPIRIYDISSGDLEILAERRVIRI
jgi:hypothetical protein